MPEREVAGTFHVPSASYQRRADGMRSMPATLGSTEKQFPCFFPLTLPSPGGRGFKCEGRGTDRTRSAERGKHCEHILTDRCNVGAIWWKLAEPTRVRVRSLGILGRLSADLATASRSGVGLEVRRQNVRGWPVGKKPGTRCAESLGVAACAGRVWIRVLLRTSKLS